MTQNELIEQFINNLDFNFTNENKKDFNTLTTFQLSIRNIIKRNEV